MTFIYLKRGIEIAQRVFAALFLLGCVVFIPVGLNFWDRMPAFVRVIWSSMLVVMGWSVFASGVVVAGGMFMLWETCKARLQSPEKQELVRVIFIILSLMIFVVICSLASMVGTLGIWHWGYPFNSDSEWMIGSLLLLIPSVICCCVACVLLRDAHMRFKNFHVIEKNDHKAKHSDRRA